MCSILHYGARARLPLPPFLERCIQHPCQLCACLQVCQVCTSHTWRMEGTAYLQSASLSHRCRQSFFETLNSCLQGFHLSFQVSNALMGQSQGTLQLPCMFTKSLM